MESRSDAVPTQNEDMKKDTRQQPLSLIPFNSHGIQKQFAKLTENFSFIIQPMLTNQDRGALMKTSKSTYLFFKNYDIERLLHHVFYGELKDAEAMIKRDSQLLLVTGSVICKHTGEILRGTPFQVAWRVKDTEMRDLFQKNMEEKDIEKQTTAQFPQGYAKYKEAEKKEIERGSKILTETFDAIHQAEIKVDEEGKLVEIDKDMKSAISHLRDYLKPKGIIATGEDITDILLLKAFELYKSNYSTFAGSASFLKRSYTCKNILAWRLVGIVQRHLKFCDIQVLSDGIHESSDKKDDGKPQGRTLTFDVCGMDGNKIGLRYNFLDMVSAPETGLGVDYTIGTNKRVLKTTGSGICDHAEDFGAYLLDKQKEFNRLSPVSKKAEQVRPTF